MSYKAKLQQLEDIFFVLIISVSIGLGSGIVQRMLTSDDTNTTTSADVQGQTCCNVCGTGEAE